MKNIVIKWAVFLTAFLISLEVSAQNVRVSGVVTDALGRSLELISWRRGLLTVQ